MSEHSLSSLERVLQRTLQRVEPPPRFVRGLGRKIQILPERPVVQRMNGLLFLLLFLIGALTMGTLGLLLSRSRRRKIASPRI